MASLSWTPRALRQLEAIHAYIAIDSPYHADKFIARLVQSCERVAAFPGLGRLYLERGHKTTRELRLENYRIQYSVRGDMVRILDIIHCARGF